MQYVGCLSTRVGTVGVRQVPACRLRAGRRGVRCRRSRYVQLSVSQFYRVRTRLEHVRNSERIGTHTYVPAVRHRSMYTNVEMFVEARALQCTATNVRYRTGTGTGAGTCTRTVP